MAGDSRRARAICAPTPAPSCSARDPGGGLVAALGQVEGDGVPGLPGGHGGFQVLQFPDLVDQGRGAVRNREAGQERGQIRDRHSKCRCRVCRNHFGPLISVHESSVPASYDIYGPPEPFHRFGSRLSSYLCK